MNAAIIAQKRTKGLHIDGPSRDFLPIGAKLFGKAAQQGDFLGIARQFIGGFQNERQLAQRGMVHDALECLNTDEALADFLVAVFVRAARVFESLICTARKRGNPTTRSNSSSTPSRSPTIS